MKIDSYAVSASAERSYVAVQSTTATYSRGTAVQAPKQEEVTPPAEEKDAEVTLSDAVKDLLEEGQEKMQQALEKAKSWKPLAIHTNYSPIPQTPKDLKIRLLEAMLSALSGKKVKMAFLDPEKYTGSDKGQTMPQMPTGGGTRPAGSGQLTTFRMEHFQYEYESVSYNAKGMVKTADGQSIDIDINLNMSREFVSYTQMDVETRQLCDPLVINYGGTAASLSGETFDFDLDMDGSLDQIYFAGEGSGFLALDKNGDGTINDGSELFGPQSGQGFEELRSYDVDGNGWIDENDEVFNQLVVWSKDKDGKDQLFRLKDLDIGAIYLGDVATQYAVKGENNETKGVMRSTSFYLKESGGAGTISHIDLML
ncbi:hypothetical protein LJC20_00705 [Eubacteriales bacterium OttesenSCG-928-M02]|nr:hypothetical protein [Eubacteriales bacterium OttesenSCG-928-M02]